MMYSGFCPRPSALIDVGPRSITSGDAPGRPLAETTFTPGTWPASWERGFTAGTGRSATFTRPMEKVVEVWGVPSITPVITTSSSRLTSVAIATSKTCSPALMVTVCVWGRNPIIRKRSVTT